jgi:hypothetical protein
LNIGVTVVLAFMVTTYDPVPPPDQPANEDPGEGDAVSVTVVPLTYCSVQSVPQDIPAGLLVTVPDPVPALDMVRVYFGSTLKVAVIDLSAVIVTVHVPVPLHPPPDQPANNDPDAGDAVSVTAAP